MGGFLQSIMFGYGGIRLLPDRLNLDPELPPDSTELHIIGLSYLGNVMDVFVTASELMVTVTSPPQSQGDGAAALLHLQVYSSGAIHDLNVKQPVTVKQQKCATEVCDNHNHNNNNNKFILSPKLPRSSVDSHKKDITYTKHTIGHKLYDTQTTAANI